MFTWILVIALTNPADGTVAQVKVPMIDEAACSAALTDVRVSRNGGRSIDWLATLCEPKS